MRILVAPDSFKGTLSANEAANIMTFALREGLPGADVVPCPLADGGEGTIEVLTPAMDLTHRTVEIPSPLGERRCVPWAVSRDHTRALVESAAVIGWSTVLEAHRDPLRSWSDGLGWVLRDVHESGIRDISVGLGGTVTIDAGLGMAENLGYRFVDSKGEIITRGSEETVLSYLKRVRKVRPPEVSWWKASSIHLLSDVSSPLTGPLGATQVFGPQKGVPKDQIESLDAAIKQYAEVVDPDGYFSTRQGAGAAGGLGWAFLALCGAELTGGAEWIMDATGVAKEIARADLIITGEGRLDLQSHMGKVVGTVARRAQMFHRPVIAVCGTVEGNPISLASSMGLMRVYSTCDSGEGTMDRSAEVRLRATMNEVSTWIRSLS